MKYCIIGAGRQGIASTYDIAKFGNPSQVLLLDLNEKLSKSGAKRINKLLGYNLVEYGNIDVNDYRSLVSILNDMNVFISAVPYHLNPQITEAAIESSTSMVDLGGHTDNVRVQLKNNQLAKESKITIVPDCGMGPGMNITMAILAMEQVDDAREIRIWDGGLPKVPIPPWNYNLFFHINGLTNEYFGDAYFIRDKKIKKVPCFEGIETIQFSDFVGKLEAAVTSGGLSTMPWTFENKLHILENKTLRYPGHWEWMKAYRELGLFSEEKVNCKGNEIIPREFYHSLLLPKINRGLVEDVCLMRVECKGKLNNKDVVATVESIEYYDYETKFTAMEKWTGWHASIMAIQIASSKIPYGAYPVELALKGSDFKDEAMKRGFDIKIKVEQI